MAQLTLSRLRSDQIRRKVGMEEAVYVETSERIYEIEMKVSELYPDEQF